MKLRVVASLVSSCMILSGCGIIQKIMPLLESVKETETMVEIETERAELPVEAVEEASESIYSLMRNEDITNLNKFLSNFSETFYHSPHNTQDNENYEMLDFAYLHNLINVPGNIGAEDVYYTISADVVDKTLERYFGKTVPHTDIRSDVYGEYDWGVWKYSNGKFFIPAADGESYSSFSIVTDIIDNKDGTYTAYFNVYFDEENIHEGVMGHWYEYSVAEAEANCTYEYKGEALIKQKVYNNKNTYELIEYKTEL